MPIVKMDRLTLVGLSKDKSDVVEALLSLGAIHIEQSIETVGVTENVETPLFGELPESIDIGGSSRLLADLPPLMSRLQQVIAASSKLRPGKSSLFSSLRAVSIGRFQSAASRKNDIFAELNQFEAAKSKISEIDSQIVRLKSTSAMLQPWENLQVDLAQKHTIRTVSFLGSFRSQIDFTRFDAALAEDAPESITEVLCEDSDGIRVHIITLDYRENLVLGLLRQSGFAFLPVQAESATPRELLERIQREQNELELAREREASLMYDIAGKREDFEIVHDYLQMLYDKLSAFKLLANTSQTFFLEGWVPSRLTSAVEKALATKFMIAFSSRPALAGETFPILLKNRKLIRPYEVVVEMFNPPKTTEIDPTPIIAPFYFIIFGMMLSDVGYGLLMSVLCGFALRKYKLKERTRKSLQVFFQCGLSSIFWGLMFGGYFGDMISVVTGGRVIIPPIMFDPLKNPTTLMLLSAGIGVAHIFVGMAAKAYILIQCGEWKSAILDVFPWYLIIIGAAMTLAGMGTPYSGYMAIAGAVIIVLFSARSARKVITRLAQGLYTLYGATSYLGDILSYSRILALVLATGVIAMVVNKIGFLGGPSVLGFAMFIAAALIGHTFNFALSALSAYIHTSRLHFVEFFSKFYEGGGYFWKPQRMTSKYIQIKRDT